MNAGLGFWVWSLGSRVLVLWSTGFWVLGLRLATRGGLTWAAADARAAARGRTAAPGVQCRFGV
jgi:hypothetical protein